MSHPNTAASEGLEVVIISVAPRVPPKANLVRFLTVNNLDSFIIVVHLELVLSELYTFPPHKVSKATI
jgi:hypothetical protein